MPSPVAPSRRSLDLTGRHVFVTGAASGIGRSLALQAAARGAVLHLTDVDADGLARVADVVRTGTGPLAPLAPGGTLATAEPLDVTDHAAVRDLAAHVTAEHGPVDVVANVAGIAVWGTVRSLTPDDWRRVVEVNLMGPIHVTEELVPPMVDAALAGDRRPRHLVNVSSAAGLIGMPWHAAYSASKFGVRGFSEVLRFDLRKHGVQVHLVVPGGVNTGLVETMRIAGVDAETRAFRRARAGFRERAVSPDDAAQAIWDGVRRGRYWVYTSPDVRVAHALQRHLPPAYVALMRAAGWAANRALPDVERARR